MIQSRRRPLILVTNDDGITAPGIRALTKAMDALGDVVVVAPADEQSAVGHSITLDRPIRVKDYNFGGELSHVHALAITGTPCDCMKLALHELMHRKPDLAVSGINMGSNIAINVIYSGTISAATESSVNGIDSIAFSLDSKDPNADFIPAGNYAKIIAQKVLRSQLPTGVVLSANIPAIPEHEINGIQVTRQARSRWQEGFVGRTDPSNKQYYWYRGVLNILDDSPDTDNQSVEDGYVSVTPLQYDRTSYGCLDVLRTWRWADAKDQSFLK
ncbi:MAG: 5'/3'-nucleotidase SurE [Bacteroidetes bacterium]|nr:5'/3'-nucleotidase SurE [Bacteroidota bacterium]